MNFQEAPKVHGPNLEKENSTHLAIHGYPMVGFIQNNLTTFIGLSLQNKKKIKKNNPLYANSKKNDMTKLKTKSHIKTIQTTFLKTLKTFNV